MARVEVRDSSVWTKHIREDAELVTRLEALKAGETIRLRVAGTAGVWEKMQNGAGGAPMHGLKPIGTARARWKELYPARRGEIVELKVDESDDEWATASMAERSAAWAAFKALTEAGWRSDRDGDRDELHER